MRVVATAAALMVLTAISRSPAKDNRSLTDFEYVQLGREISVPAPDDAAPGSLGERLVLARASIKALTEALGIANSEAEVFKRQVTDLQLKLDAYGLAGLEKEPEKIEQRLLSAVRDLRILKKQNEDAVNGLVRLSESLTSPLTASSFCCFSRRRSRTAVSSRCSIFSGSFSRPASP